MTMTYANAIKSDNGGVAANPAVISYPAGVVAGNLLIMSMFTRGSSGIQGNTPPTGWTRITGQLQTYAQATFYRIADGSESGTFNYTMGGSYIYSAQVSRFTSTGLFTPASVYGAVTNVDTVDNDTFVGPDPGTPEVGGYGWSMGSARNGTLSTTTVSNNGWTIAGSSGYPADPGKLSIVLTAYKTAPTSGAATFKYGNANDFQDFMGAAFLMKDFPSSAPGLFFGTNH